MYKFYVKLNAKSKRNLTALKITKEIKTIQQKHTKLEMNKKKKRKKNEMGISVKLGYGMLILIPSINIQPFFQNMKKALKKNENENE